MIFPLDPAPCAEDTAPGQFAHVLHLSGGVVAWCLGTLLSAGT